MSTQGGQGRRRSRAALLLAALLLGAGDEEDRRRRLLAVVLLLALLVLGAVLGIIGLFAPSHHQATASPSTAAGPPGALIGGGGVTPRRLSGDLRARGCVGDVLFAEDGTALDRSARTVIGTAARVIGDRHPAVVTVTGYTDAIGSTGANRALSLRRARAVIAELRRDPGGSAVSYRALARGQARPVASNSTPSGRQLNRRVVITIG